MLTKKDLKDYPNLITEIDDLTRRINKSLKEIVTDVVSSSSPDFPYTAHSTSIHGVSPNQSLSLPTRGAWVEISFTICAFNLRERGLKYVCRSVWQRRWFYTVSSYTPPILLYHTL